MSGSGYAELAAKEGTDDLPPVMHYSFLQVSAICIPLSIMFRV
jgi:hypothetical protein